LQIESNIWRYQLAAKASEYILTYETILHNQHYAIDPDIWRYPLLINPKGTNEYVAAKFLSHYKHYVYSCEKTCDIYKVEVESLKKRYKYVRIQLDNAEEYVFFLQIPQNNINKTIKIKSSNNPNIFGLSVYRKVREVLKVPQI